MCVSQKRKELESKAKNNGIVSIESAIADIKLLHCTKFNESIDVAVELGIDVKKQDQNIRGCVILPNGTGKLKKY